MTFLRFFQTLSRILAEFYEKETDLQGVISSIDPNAVEVGHACMVRDIETKRWCRAIVQLKGNDDCLVQLVDWGKTQFTQYPKIFPLISFAARWPPFAIHSQLHGIICYIFMGYFFYQIMFLRSIMP